MSPYIGKQLSNRWLAGIEMRYQFNRYIAKNITIFPNTDLVDYRRNTNGVGIVLFARYSFMPGNRFDFFLQPFALYFSINEKEFVDGEPDGEEKANYVSVGSDLGVLYNFTDRWRAILRVGGLRYINGNCEGVGTTEGNDFSSFGLNLSLDSLGFGVEFKL